jgi:hypothetical protein
MSEFSVSYHIRVGEGPDAQKVLRQAVRGGDWQDTNDPD